MGKQYPKEFIDFINHASSNKVILSGAQRIDSIKTWPFLDPSSSVTDLKAKQYIEKIYKTTTTESDADALADYLALSTACHLLDGWRYISQAAHSLMRGSRNVALHLAYYAELRAGLSILSGAGIGIVNRHHFSISEDGVIHWYTGSSSANSFSSQLGVKISQSDTQTVNCSNELAAKPCAPGSLRSSHDITWAALSIWSKNMTNASAVIDCFQAHGLSARDWANGSNLDKYSLTDIACMWMEDWSIDLTKFDKDRDQRNIASYNPNLCSNAFDSVAVEEIDIIISMVNSCLPFNRNQLGDLDTAIIQNLCECIHKNKGGKGVDFRNDLRGWLIRDQGKSVLDAKGIVQNLKDSGERWGGRVIKTAQSSNTGVTGIICRAFLLLRLATALNRNLWTQMQNLSKNGNLEWIERILSLYGLQCQLWDLGAEPENFDLLETDLNDLVDSVESYLSSLSHPQDITRILNSRDLIMNLCQFERIGVMAAAL